jgi:hypothetical protein
MIDNRKDLFVDGPLLLKSARPRNAAIQDYRYDPAQALNVSNDDGRPVVGSKRGRSMLKTMAEAARGED